MPIAISASASYSYGAWLNSFWLARRSWPSAQRAPCRARRARRRSAGAGATSNLRDRT